MEQQLRRLVFFLTLSAFSSGQLSRECNLEPVASRISCRNIKFSHPLGSQFATSIQTSRIFEIFIISSDVGSLSENDFIGFDSLNTLVIQKSILHSINKQTFGALSKLAMIKIDNTEWNCLYSGQFKNNKKLTELHLTNNRITSILPDTFPHNLTELDLSHNQIGSVASSSFHGVSSLQRLKLSGNRLKNVSSSLLEFLPELKVLHLDSNEIENIDPGALNNCRNLKELLLSFNRLTYLSSKTFRNVPHLSTLHIDHNALSRLGNDLFTGLNELQNLWLHGNGIVDFGMFKINPNVEVHLDFPSISFIETTANMAFFKGGRFFVHSEFTEETDIVIYFQNKNIYKTGNVDEAEIINSNGIAQCAENLDNCTTNICKSLQYSSSKTFLYANNSYIGGNVIPVENSQDASSENQTESTSDQRDRSSDDTLSFRTVTQNVEGLNTAETEVSQSHSNENSGIYLTEKPKETSEGETISVLSHTSVESSSKATTIVSSNNNENVVLQREDTFTRTTPHTYYKSQDNDIKELTSLLNDIMILLKILLYILIPMIVIVVMSCMVWIIENWFNRRQKNKKARRQLIKRYHYSENASLISKSVAQSESDDSNSELDNVRVSFGNMSQDKHIGQNERTQDHYENNMTVDSRAPSNLEENFQGGPASTYIESMITRQMNARNNPYTHHSGRSSQNSFISLNSDESYATSTTPVAFPSHTGAGVSTTFVNPLHIASFQHSQPFDFESTRPESETGVHQSDHSGGRGGEDNARRERVLEVLPAEEVQKQLQQISNDRADATDSTRSGLDVTNPSDLLQTKSVVQPRPSTVSPPDVEVVGASSPAVSKGSPREEVVHLPLRVQSSGALKKAATFPLRTRRSLIRRTAFTAQQQSSLPIVSRNGDQPSDRWEMESVRKQIFHDRDDAIDSSHSGLDDPIPSELLQTKPVVRPRRSTVSPPGADVVGASSPAASEGYPREEAVHLPLRVQSSKALKKAATFPLRIKQTSPVAAQEQSSLTVVPRNADQPSDGSETESVRKGAASPKQRAEPNASVRRRRAVSNPSIPKAFEETARPPARSPSLDERAWRSSLTAADPAADPSEEPRRKVSELMKIFQ